MTERQRTVLTMRCAGKSFKQIGGELGICLKTVQYHWRCVQRRIGVMDLALIVRWAIANGLLVVLLLSGCAHKPAIRPMARNAALAPRKLWLQWDYQQTGMVFQVFSAKGLTAIGDFRFYCQTTNLAVEIMPTNQAEYFAVRAVNSDRVYGPWATK